MIFINVRKSHETKKKSQNAIKLSNKPQNHLKTKIVHHIVNEEVKFS
jgi:hypothetical protein